MRRHLALGLIAWSIGFPVVAGVGPAMAAALPAGPVPGHLMPFSAVVWVQADAISDGRLQYWPHGRPTERLLSQSLRLDEGNGFSGHLHVHGLMPGTVYDYRVVLDGAPTTETAIGSFRTLPAPGGPLPSLTLALGSCAYLPDPLPLEGWLFQGILHAPYGDTYGIFDAIAAKHPDLMVWLGDNLYLRPQDVALPGGIARRYWLHRGHPALTALLRGTHHVALWDDHDMGWDNSDRHYWGRMASTALFEQYWANPTYGLPTVPGIFSVVHLPDVDIFLLDDRTYRDEDASPDSPNKQMLGDGQLAWLQAELSRSTATFKLVCNGSQMLNVEGRAEGWHHFPAERARFLTWLAHSQVPGVILVSGDRHQSVLLKEQRPGLYPLYELTCSPLTSHPVTRLQESLRPKMVADTFVPSRNFGLLKIVGPSGDRTLTLSVCDPQGQPIWVKGLRQRELQ